MANRDVTRGIGILHAESQKAREEKAQRDPQDAIFDAPFYNNMGEMNGANLPVPDSAAPDLCRSNIYPELRGGGGPSGCD